VPSLGQNAREGLSRPAGRAVDLAGYGVGAVLASVAGLRGGKAVHPSGVVHRARLVIDGAGVTPQGATLLDEPATWHALVRFSRSVGIPRPLPDLLGVSLRVLNAYGRDRHQDVLTVSSVDVPVLHHIFVPARDVQQRPYSSSLPYRVGDRSLILGVTPDPRSPRPSGEDEFDRLDRAAATGRLQFGFAVATLGGRFRRVGTLQVGERLPDTLDALRFNPFNCGGGLEPAGWLNRLRDYAYPLSQAAWGRRGGRAHSQRLADRQVDELANGPIERPTG
jgi:hypothetical protein